MKRLLLPVFIAFLGATPLLAQPTITAANNLQIGDQFLVHETTVASPEFTTAALAGANQTWNFSTLSSVAGRPAAILARSAAPKPASYPAANMVIQVGDDYAFIENSNAVIKEHAAFNAVQNISMENTEPAEKLRFPLNYQDTFSDTFTGSADLGGSTFPRIGTVTVTAEGYGTLVTPTGTYQNVLKLKTEELANPNTLFSEQTVTYDWFMPGVRFPVLRMTRRVTLPATVFSAFYLDQVLSTKEALTGPTFSIFPNPASGKAFIQFGETVKAGAKLRITNLLGQEIKELPLEMENAGSPVYKLDVSGVAKGVYLVKLESAGKASVNQLVIQ